MLALLATVLNKGHLWFWICRRKFFMVLILGCPQDLVSVSLLWAGFILRAILYFKSPRKSGWGGGGGHNSIRVASSLRCFDWSLEAGMESVPSKLVDRQEGEKGHSLQRKTVIPDLGLLVHNCKRGPDWLVLGQVPTPSPNPWKTE